MSKETFDISKPFKTIGGEEVTILCTNGRDPYPLVGYIGNRVATNSWRRDGYNGLSVGDNLVNVPPPKKKIFVNVFKKDESLTKQLEMDADFHADSWSQAKQASERVRDKYCFVAGYLAAKSNPMSGYHFAECVTLVGQSITKHEMDQMKKTFPSYLGTFEIEVEGD